MASAVFLVVMIITLIWLLRDEDFMRAFWRERQSDQELQRHALRASLLSKNEPHDL